MEKQDTTQYHDQIQRSPKYKNKDRKPLSKMARSHDQILSALHESQCMEIDMPNIQELYSNMGKAHWLNKAKN